MVVKFPCGICTRQVSKNHRAIKCDSCEKWIHIKCNNLETRTYQSLINDNNSWYCIKCLKNIIPLSSLSDNEFHLTLNGTNQFSNSLSFEVPNHLKEMFKNLNDISNAAINCKYYDTTDQNKIIQKKNQKMFLHINIASVA